MTEYTTQPGNSPAVNPDVQEALSIKYGNGAVIVVPLSSGALAIFDRAFALQDIIDDPTQGSFASYAFAFKHALMNKSAEAAFYGEPDNETFKRDMQARKRAEAKVEREAANKPTFNTSSFVF